jgi:hypothetical protein
MKHVTIVFYVYFLPKMVSAFYLSILICGMDFSFPANVKANETSYEDFVYVTFSAIFLLILS